MRFSHELNREEWRGLIQLSEQACRYPADQTRWLIREVLVASGLLTEAEPTEPEPEDQESLCDHR